MRKKYHSKILQVIHKDMEGLHKLGIITDTEMQEFDDDCLEQEPSKNHSPVSSAGTKRVDRISAKSLGSK